MNKLLKQLFTRWLASKLRISWQLLRYKIKFALSSKPPKVEVYLALNDPYSFVLVQLLPRLQERYNISFEVFLIANANNEMVANHALWQQWAVVDANQLATRYDLIKINKLPEAHYIETGQQEWLLQPKTIENALNIFKKTWLEEFKEFYALSTPVINSLVNNQYRQKVKGHYLPATMRFAGEWFWGVDRLNHLESKLSLFSLGNSKASSLFTKTQLNLSGLTTLDDNQPIHVYVSLRSPYSYLGFVQAQRLAQHYKRKLDIHLVMPMVMRGMKVSRNKQKYIFTDAVREARLKDIPFGKFADPIGPGILNSYQFFSYAKYIGRAEDYIAAMFKAIYVDGIDLSRADTVQSICHDIGLDIEAAVNYANHDNWQTTIEKTADKLQEQGFWGVPVFTCGDIACWGQDRLWQIEQAIIEISDS